MATYQDYVSALDALANPANGGQTARINPEPIMTSSNYSKSFSLYNAHKYNQQLWNVIDGTTGYLKKADAPSAVSDLTNDLNFQTDTDVATAIANALGASGVSFSHVNTLPATGAEHVIYLVPNSGSNDNVHDEYIWDATNSQFEKIGSTDIDLSGYVEINDLKSKGSATQPIFFDTNGEAQATQYALNKTVPADAVFTDTTYTNGSGINITGNVISVDPTSINAGVTSVAEGSTDGAISVTTNGTTTSVSVHGLGSAAYADTTDFLTSSSNLGVSAVAESTDDGKISVTTNGTTVQVPIHGLGSAAFADTTDFMSGSASTGVSAVAEGTGNGQIAVTANGTTTQVNVHGLGTAAYTASTDYLAANTTYAGSTTAGGSAASAVKLDDTNVGSATKGVYIGSNGKPSAMTYSVEANVPSSAVFTDTIYTEGTGIDIDTSNNNAIGLDSNTQSSLALADTALQPEDIVLVTDAQIEAMFA